MPFNGSNRIEALFAFVDQYIAGDAAMRSGFDQIVGDLVSSVNALATYLESLSAAGTDQRYLGRVVVVPTQRVDTTALQAGDFYVAGHADAGRVGLAYVYDGAAFDVVSDFSTIGDFFKDTLSAAATTAAARSALELGSAATQNSTAFAAASVATDVALAIKLLTNGIAKSMTDNDWNNAHLAGPGTTMVQANAAAANAPVALNAAGIYVAYDANNGFLIAVAHSTGALYYRSRVAAVWGAWLKVANLDATATGISVRSGADVVQRQITSANGSVTITNPAGIAGDIDLSANAVGFGQTWQNVIGSRTAGTSYQNLTGRSIMVSISMQDNTKLIQVSTDNATWVTLGRGAENSNDRDGTAFIVPSTHYYRTTAAAVISYWAELRT